MFPGFGSLNTGGGGLSSGVTGGPVSSSSGPVNFGRLPDSDNGYQPIVNSGSVTTIAVLVALTLIAWRVSR